MSKFNDENEINDFVLIARYLSGNTTSFDDIVNKYQNRIYSLCYRYLHDHHEAQDCTQEVFLKLHKKLHSFKKNSKFSTWLFTVTVNTCKNKLKWLKIRNFFSLMSLNKKLNDNNLDNTEFINFIKDENTPETILEKKEKEILLYNCINKLKPQNRGIIFMKDKENMNYKEICEITGFSLSKIKSIIHRSRLKIAEEIKKINGDLNE